MSEWNRALRMAQRILSNRAASLPSMEMGMPGNMVAHPQVAGLKAAVSEIEALIEPEKDDRLDLRREDEP